MSGRSGARTLCTAVALALCVAGCFRGPSEDVLRDDLLSRVELGFEQGLFSVPSFRRRGSAPFRDVERGSGLFVYYEADLEFLRDYALTSWRGLNLGSLAYALGARESGVSGLDASGNREGDRLSVRGRLSYVWEEEEDAWRALTIEAPEPSTEREARPLEGSGPAAVLSAVRALASRESAPDPGTRDATVVAELSRALERIDLRFAHLDGMLTLGTGPRAGTYHAFGAAFAPFATRLGIPFHSHPTEGSVDNGLQLASGQLDFAVMQSDVAEVLYEGWAVGGRGPLTDLRSVASLWPEAVHVIARGGTGIQRLADLEGKRVGIGPSGSGSSFNAARLARAAGLTRESFAAIFEGPHARAIAALEAGELDALVVTEAIPSRILQEVTRRQPDLVFVSVEPELIEQLASEHFAYYPLEVPARTYPSQEAPFRTLGLAAALLTDVAADDAAVEAVLGALLDETDELARDYYRAGFISRETVRLGIAVPLHRAADRFHREREGDAPASGPAGPPEVRDDAPGKSREGGAG